MTQEAYQRCLFQNGGEKSKAFERMNSLQSLNQTYIGEGSTAGQTAHSTEAYTRDSVLMENLMLEEEAIFQKNSNEKWIKGKKADFDIKKVYTMNIEDVEQSTDQNQSSEGQIQDSKRVVFSSRLLEVVCNHPSKFQRKLYLFKLSFLICMLIIGVQYLLEIISGKFFLENANVYLEMDYQISSLQNSLQNLKSQIQLTYLTQDMIDGIKQKSTAQGNTNAQLSDLVKAEDTLKFARDLHSNLIEQETTSIFNGLEFVQESYQQKNVYSGMFEKILHTSRTLNLANITSAYLSTTPNLKLRVLEDEQNQIFENIEFQDDADKRESIHQKIESMRIDLEKASTFSPKRKFTGRIILKVNREQKSQQSAFSNTADLVKINPYNQLGLVKQDVVQASKDENILSLINLQTYHQELLKKVEYELKNLVEENLGNISTYVTLSFWMHLVSFLAPILYSLILQLRYLSDMITNFKNLGCLSSSEMKKQISVLKNAEEDFKTLGKEFEQEDHAEEQRDLNHSFMASLMGEEAGEEDEYSQYQRKNYGQRFRSFQSEDKEEEPKFLDSFGEENGELPKDGKNDDDFENQNPDRLIKRKKLSESFNASDIDSNKNYYILKESEDQKRMKNELFKKLGIGEVNPKDLLTHSIEYSPSKEDDMYRIQIEPSSNMLAESHSNMLFQGSSQLNSTQQKFAGTFATEKTPLRIEVERIQDAGTRSQQLRTSSLEIGKESVPVFQRETENVANKNQNINAVKKIKQKARKQFIAKTIVAVEDFGRNKLVVWIVALFFIIIYCNYEKISTRNINITEMGLRHNYILNLTKIYGNVKHVDSNTLNLLFWENVRLRNVLKVESEFMKLLDFDWIKDLVIDTTSSGSSSKSTEDLEYFYLSYGLDRITHLEEQVEKSQNQLPKLSKIFQEFSTESGGLNIQYDNKIDLDGFSEDTRVFEKVYFVKGELRDECEVYLNRTYATLTPEELKSISLVDHHELDQNFSASILPQDMFKKMLAVHQHFLSEKSQMLDEFLNLQKQIDSKLNLTNPFKDQSLMTICKQAKTSTFKKGWSFYQPQLFSDAKLDYQFFQGFKSRYNTLLQKDELDQESKWKSYLVSLYDEYYETLLRISIDRVFEAVIEDHIQKIDSQALRGKLVQLNKKRLKYETIGTSVFILLQAVFCVFIARFLQNELTYKYEVHQRFLGLLDVKVIRQKKIFKNYIALYDKLAAKSLYDDSMSGQQTDFQFYRK